MCHGKDEQDNCYPSGRGDELGHMYSTKNNFILFSIILEYIFYVAHQMCPAFIGI